MSSVKVTVGLPTIVTQITAAGGVANIKFSKIGLQGPKGDKGDKGDEATIADGADLNMSGDFTVLGKARFGHASDAPFRRPSGVADNPVAPMSLWMDYTSHHLVNGPIIAGAQTIPHLMLGYSVSPTRGQMAAPVGGTHPTIGGVSFNISDGTRFREAAAITAGLTTGGTPDGLPLSGGGYPGRLRFFVGSAATGASAEIMRLEDTAGAQVFRKLTVSGDLEQTGRQFMRGRPGEDVNFNLISESGKWAPYLFFFGNGGVADSNFGTIRAVTADSGVTRQLGIYGWHGSIMGAANTAIAVATGTGLAVTGNVSATGNSVVGNNSAFQGTTTGNAILNLAQLDNGNNVHLSNVSTTNTYINAASAGVVRFNLGATTYGTFSNTGLAVDGNVTAIRQFLNHATAGVGVYFQKAGSTLASVAKGSNDSMYYEVGAAKNHDFFVGASSVAVIASTGLAVAGSITANNLVTTPDLEKVNTFGRYSSGIPAVFFDGSAGTTSFRFRLTSAATNMTLDGSGLGVTGAVSATGLMSNNTFLNTGTGYGRFQGTGGAAVVGASGFGVDLFQSGSGGFVSAFDRTNNVRIPIYLVGSNIKMQAGEDVIATFSPTGLAVTGVTTSTTGFIATGGSYSAPVAGSGRMYGTATNGLNFVGNGSSSDIAFHASGGATLATLNASGLAVAGSITNNVTSGPSNLDLQRNGVSKTLLQAGTNGTSYLYAKGGGGIQFGASSTDGGALSDIMHLNTSGLAVAGTIQSSSYVYAVVSAIVSAHPASQISSLDLRGIGGSTADGLKIEAGGSTAWYSCNTHNIRLANSTTIATFNASGLAVTGQISATGNAVLSGSGGFYSVAPNGTSRVYMYATNGAHYLVARSTSSGLPEPITYEASVHQFVGGPIQGSAPFRSVVDPLLQLTDANGTVVASNNSTVITIPADGTVNFQIGTKIQIAQWAAGSVTLTRGSGVSLYWYNGNGSPPVDGNRTMVVGANALLVKMNANVWAIFNSQGIS